MITITEVSKRKYEIHRDDVLLIEMELVFSPVSNKFHKIVDFIQDASKQLGDEFDDFFEKYVVDYKESKFDASVLLKSIPKMKKLCDKYLEKLNINFNNYVNIEKKSKNSIFFDAEELEKMIKASTYLKFYFVICQDLNMKPPIKFHKQIYNDLLSDLSNCEIIYKLFKLVSSKTYRYNISDKAMWDFLKLVHCKTTDMHVNTIFNFLMNNILVTCNADSNPIPYFSSVIDESIRWILNGVYKDSVVYSDTINTEDIHTISGKDNLLSYCYNDTIGKLVADASNYLEELGITDISNFNSIVSQLKEPSLLSNYIVFPILSKVFNIPYRYFRPIPTEHAYMLNLLTLHYLPDTLKNELQTLIKLLLYYNEEKPILKTTYKIKNYSEYFSTYKEFLGFKNLIFAYDFYSELIGKLARNKYIGFITGKQIMNFPLAKLEQNMIKFYNMYFSGDLDESFSQMREQMEKHM